MCVVYARHLCLLGILIVKLVKTKHDKGLGLTVSGKSLSLKELKKEVQKAQEIKIARVGSAVKITTTKNI